MTRCPDCDATVEDDQDVEFVEWENVNVERLVVWAWEEAPKQMYLVACAECGAAIGGGVAAWKA